MRTYVFVKKTSIQKPENRECVFSGMPVKWVENALKWVIIAV